VLPYSSVYHHYKKLQRTVHESLQFDKPSNALLRLAGQVGEMGLCNEDLSRVVERTLVGFILGQSFMKEKCKLRKFQKSEDLYRVVGQTIVRLFRVLNLKKAILKDSPFRNLYRRKKVKTLLFDVVPDDTYVRLITS